MSGGNGYIDPLKAIGKLKKHGRGLWAMQAVVAFAMSVIAVVTGEAKYGSTIKSATAIRAAPVPVPDTWRSFFYNVSNASAVSDIHLCKLRDIPGLLILVFLEDV